MQSVILLSSNLINLIIWTKRRNKWFVSFPGDRESQLSSRQEIASFISASFMTLSGYDSTPLFRDSEGNEVDNLHERQIAVDNELQINGGYSELR